MSFRNIVVHGYDAVNDTIVWGVLLKDIPELLAQLDGLINEIDNSSA